MICAFFSFFAVVTEQICFTFNDASGVSEFASLSSLYATEFSDFANICFNENSTTALASEMNVSATLQIFDDLNSSTALYVAGSGNDAASTTVFNDGLT